MTEAPVDGTALNDLQSVDRQWRSSSARARSHSQSCLCVTSSRDGVLDAPRGCFRQRGEARLAGMELTCCGSWGDEINIRGELQLLEAGQKIGLPGFLRYGLRTLPLASLPHFQGIL